MMGRNTENHESFSEAFQQLVPTEFSTDALAQSARGARGLFFISWSRLLALIPALGLFVISAVIVFVTSAEAVKVTVEGFHGGVHLTQLAVEYVEFTDLYLLAIALFIMALGIFSLFITDRIPMPKWLEFHDFDDLKERLVSVIVVMLGVYFLGTVLKGGHGLDLLWLGLSIAVVVIALSFFVRFVFKGEEEPTETSEAAEV
ncbi:MAG: YqhA family protein [Actinomycetaceae bacterium]|nr:YqhA family protein [Actinomycetaceae bacterium]